MIYTIRDTKLKLVCKEPQFLVLKQLHHGSKPYIVAVNYVIDGEKLTWEYGKYELSMCGVMQYLAENGFEIS